MKIVANVVALMVASPALAFVPSLPKSMIVAGKGSSSSLSMVLEKPATKEISKLEMLKVNSKNLIHPLKEVSIWFIVSCRHRCLQKLLFVV